MKFKAKLRFCIIYASLGLSISAVCIPEVFAYNSQDGCPNLEVNLTGGWFQNDTANTSYGILRTERTLPDAGFNIAPTGKILAIKPKYKFDGGASILYQSDSCYNLGASYFSYHNKHRETVFGGTSDTPLITATLISGLFNSAEPQVSSVKSQYDFRYEFSNFELGSRFCAIDDSLTLNPKIGLSYARIRNDQSTEYSGATNFFADPTGKDTVKLLSKYRGFGPSIGADVDYLICHGFSIFGTTRYSALVGNLYCEWINRVTGTTDQGGLPANLYSGTLNARSRGQIVQLFQFELALGYTFDFCGYYARILAGYQLTKALDSKKRIDLNSQSGAPASGIVLSDGLLNSSFQGPFIRLSFGF